MIKIVSNRGILEIIILFAVVLVMGFLIAYAALVTSKVSVINSSLSSPQFTYFAYALDVAVFGILLLIVLRRHHSKTLLFRVLEFIIIGFTSFFVFLVVYSIILPQQIGFVARLPNHIEYVIALPQSLSGSWDYLLAAISAILLVIFKELHPRARDAATMVSSIGVGVLLGISFAFTYAMIILAIVAFYDYITIFLTKAAVKFDRALISMNISFLISVSDLQSLPRGSFSEKEEDRYEQHLIRTHEADDPRYKRIIRQGRIPVLSQISLGEGDLSLPLMAAISAYYSFFNYAFTAIIMLGAMAGVIVTMLLLKRFKKPLPAIPPFFGLISIASGIAYIYIGHGLSIQPIIFMAAGMIIMFSTFYSLVKEDEKTDSLQKDRIRSRLYRNPR